MRNKFLFLIIFIISFFSFAYAKPILNIQQWHTPAGTPVYFVKAPQIPMVDILVAFQAGSSRDGQNYGLASLTSSMLGEATKQLSANQIADKIDSLGMVFDTNTSRDMTTIHLRSLTEEKYLKPSVELFDELLSQATFPEKAFNRVKNNTLFDIAQQQQDPNQVANKAFAKVIFANTPYAHPSIGETNTVKTLTPAEVEQFYKRYYVAANTMIVMVGDITEAQAKSISSEITNSLPKGTVAPKLSPVANNSASSKHIPFPANQTSILMGEVSLTPKESLNPALIVGNYILGAPLTSLLFNSVREKYGLTYGIGSYFLPLANRGAFIISLQTKNSQTEKAIAVTQQTLKDFLSNGPTEKQLQAAKDFLIGNFPLKIESNAQIASYVLNAAFYDLPLDYLDTYKEKVNAVTAAEVKSAMQEYVNPQRFAVLTVGGKS